MKKYLTSFGWIWKNEHGKQVASQVGHEWNGEFLSKMEKRILRKLTGK